MLLAVAMTLIQSKFVGIFKVLKHKKIYDNPFLYQVFFDSVIHSILGILILYQTIIHYKYNAYFYHLLNYILQL